MTNIPPAPPDSMPLLKAAARKAGLAETALGATLLWLAEQLAGEEFAKLGQGGHTHNQVPLRRVFVDLPVNSPHRSERVNFLDVFLRAGPVDLQKACSFNVAGRIVSENEDERSNAKKGIPRVDFAAVLLIGGPGQGKSTLGQLACQLQRAALLRPFRSQLAYNHRDILESFDAPVADDSSSLALAARPLLPLQVSLPELAGWLATAAPRAVSTHDTYSILEFLASLPSARKSGIAGSHLFNLAVSMPSLIVLDGFDEVGATLDRERIVTATRELLSGLAERGAEAKVIAATRPQGYGGELGRIGVSLQQCVLAPLEYSEAIGYAEKLVQAKVPGVDFQQKTLSRLREAAKEPATARLLTTPLQVTILTALVQQGRAPRERWKLFWSYFDYTYKREIERETYASRLLADHRSHIEQIHSRVALLLQVEAERDGGAAARMPRNRLEGIVDTILAEDEIEAGARRELVEDILVAAEQRLVFLVEPEPGSFGFEIRSLQEFMAAWALTSGREADVKTRLQQVVRAPMFRNVLLFIASRLFSEGSHLRDALADEICGHLDGEPTEVFGRTTKPGALLALEILEEGAVLSQPKRARALMERAVGLFSVAAGAEHLRLARVVNADTVGIVEAAILASVHENGGTRLSAAAWTCIFEGASRNEDWAKRLADELWDYLVGSNEVWQACIRARVPIGSWMAKKIELSASAFPPEEVIRAVVTAERVASCWIEWLAAVYEKIDRPRGIPSFAMRGVQLQGSIEAPASEELPAPPTAWKPWIAAAKYELSPSIDGLADTLDSIAEQLPTDRWPSLAFRSTWPLAACLYGAGSRDELSDFSARLRRGELGDSKTWHDSQATWQLDSVRPLSGLSDSALPWSLAGISKSPPFHLLSPFHFVHHNPEAIQLVESASGHLATTTNRVARRKLAEFCLSCLRSLPPKTGVAEIDILTWVNEAPEAIGHLIPRPRVVTKKLWLKVLDAVAQAGLRSRAFVGLEGALVAIVDSGGNTVATNMAIDALRMRVSRNDVAWAEVSLPRKPRVAATLRAVAARGGDRGIIAILRLLAEDILAEEDDAALDDVAASAHARPHLWEAFMGALQVSKLPVTRRAQLLARANAHMGVRGPYARDAVELARRFMESSRSELDSASVWIRLGLPLPQPTPGARRPMDGGVPDAPIVVQTIRLADVRGIRELAIEGVAPEAGHGQWIVLLGPNGSGKTTILRSLVVALRNTRDPSIWPKGVFASRWLRSAVGDERIAEASIIVQLGDGVRRETRIRASDDMSISQEPELTRQRLFPIFAYGCRRGSALGGIAREVNLQEDDGPEVATLFDGGAALIHAETWLLQWDGDAKKSLRSKLVFNAVVGALVTFLAVESLNFHDRRVWVVEKGGPEIPFDSLSDGFLTSAGWLVDLMARWIDFAHRHGEHIGTDFLSTMRGLVLIDEIDLHLHPRWQVDVVSRTRSLMPQMSFIVTTHNPLTLVGASPQEIWMLERNGAEVKVSRGTEEPFLLTSAQIYQRYFGIRDIYPTQLGRKVHRFMFLAGYSARSDEEEGELRSLERDLRGAGIELDWPIAERRTQLGGDS